MLHIDRAFYIAPLHASVLHQEGTWRLLPRNHSLVSVVNGVRAPWGEGLPLQPGDTIELGFVSLKVEEASPVDPYFDEGLWGDSPGMTEEGEPAALPDLSPDAQITAETTASSSPSVLKDYGSSIEAAALVALLEHDSAAGTEGCSFRDEEPLADLLQAEEISFLSPNHTSPPEEDILVRLARESDRLLQDPDLSGLLATETALMTLHPQNFSAERAETDVEGGLPSDILPSTPETSLHDLLEGPLDVDDVLELLGTSEDCPLLTPESSPEDPLRLLAGNLGPDFPRLRPVAPITRRDHHSLGMETPCRSVSNAPTLLPSENACRLRKK